MYRDSAPCEFDRALRVKNRGIVMWPHCYTSIARTGRGGREGKRKNRELPLLSAGSACYLFWKKCAPATPAHAALLHRGQVFQASPPRERTATSPERSPKRSHSRAQNATPPSREPRTHCARHPRGASRGPPISFMGIRAFHFAPRSRAPLPRACVSGARVPVSRRMPLHARLSPFFFIANQARNK